MQTPRRDLLLILALAALFVASCGRPPRSNPEPTLPPGTAAVPETLAAPPATQDASGQTVPLVPDPHLTPGDTLPVTVADICTPGYSKKVRNVPVGLKRKVYDEYGIAHRDPGEFEVDHLISLELGGSNSIRNLWPESYTSKPWNAHVKDKLENELHREVCSGELDLKAAQHEIAANWIEAYRKHFHTDVPLASSSTSSARRKSRE